MSNTQKIHGVNLAGNSFFENLCVERLSSDPSPLTTSGRIWYNTITNQLKISVYDGVSSVIVKVLNSSLLDNLYSGTLLISKIKPSADSTTAVMITKADGSTPVATFDTINKNLIVAGSISSSNINWRPLIAGTDFNITGASTSTVTMLTNQTSNISIGDQIKFKLSGTYYYGRCTAITSNLLTVGGAPLTTTASALTELYFSKTQYFISPLSTIVFSGYFASATNTTMLETKLSMKGGYIWEHPKVYLVGVRIIASSYDTGAGVTTQPAFNITRNGSSMLSTGLTIANGTQVISGIQFNTAQYLISYNDVIECTVSAASGGTPLNNSTNLKVQLYYVKDW